MASASRIKPGKSAIELDDEAWRDIEAKLGVVEPDLLLRERLVHFVMRVLGFSGPAPFGAIEGPRISQVKYLLKALRVQAEQLRYTLVQLNELANKPETDKQSVNAGRTLYLALTEWASLLDKNYPSLWRAIETTEHYSASEQSKNGLAELQSASRAPHGAEKFAISVVSYLADACEAAIKALPTSTGGAPKDTEMFWLIFMLAFLFREETGKTPRGDEFLDFGYACCRAFSPKRRTMSKAAFEKAVKRVLKKVPVEAWR